MQALNKTKNHYTSVQLAWPSSGTFPNRRDLITWRNMTAPLQPARIMQRWSNTTWRGKFQGRSHHFCNNYIGRCSMSFSYMLDDAHAGLSHRPPLLQNELSVPSSTRLYCSKGRTLDGVYGSALDISHTDRQDLRWQSVSCRNQVCSVGPCTAHCWYYSHTLHTTRQPHLAQQNKV